MVGEEGHIGRAGGIGALHFLQLRGDAVRAAPQHALDDLAGEREVEVQRKLITARHRGRIAVIGRDELGVGPVLADQRRVRLYGADVRGEFLPVGVRLRRVRLSGSGTVLHQVAGRIETEAVDAAAQPQRGDALHLLAHGRRAVVEVGHPAPEDAVVPGAPPLMPGLGSGVPGLSPVELGRAPDVPVALRRGGRGRLPEPGMRRSGVVQHQIDHNLDASPVRLRDQLVEVRIGAVVAVDGLVVGGVVTVIARGGEHRHQPERIDAQIGGGRWIAVVEIVETRDQSLQIAFAVAVRVLEAPHEHLVEDSAVRPGLQRAIAGSTDWSGAGNGTRESGREGKGSIAHGRASYRDSLQAISASSLAAEETGQLALAYCSFASACFALRRKPSSSV